MGELGYRLEDELGAPSVWKPVDPALLKREAAERQRTRVAVQRTKIEQTLKLKQTVRADSSAVPPVFFDRPWPFNIPTCVGHYCAMFRGGLIFL